MSYQKTVNLATTLLYSTLHKLVYTCSMHYAALVGVYAVYFDAERDCFLFVNIESILPPSSLVQMCFVFISYGSLQWVAFECITVNSKCIYM